MVLLLSMMLHPEQVTMVPIFLIWRGLGWYNTLNPLWVPSFLGVAFFIFLMTQHMKTIPRELEESARVDGLNAVQTWYYIILPQVKPAAAAVAVMTFMWSWNEFLSPLRSEEHTSELQSPCNLVCRLLLEKKKIYIMP